MKIGKVIAYCVAAILLIAIGAGAVYLLMGRHLTVQQSEPHSSDNSSHQSSGNGQADNQPTSDNCLSSELSLSIDNDAGGGVAGSVYKTVVLTNSGHRTCELAGYPGVSLLNGDDQQVGQPAGRSATDNALTIALAPGKSAGATLRVVMDNYGPGVCKKGASQLRVYPPNDTEPLTIKTTISTWCPGFSVGPMVVR